ncbi:MAG: hypothetical protein SGJ09_17840 [Phycisphaerae bacterium]|nr:hypothetical protein [Phycisphaerae bacterium]
MTAVRLLFSLAVILAPVCGPIFGLVWVATGVAGCSAAAEQVQLAQNQHAGGDFEGAYQTLTGDGTKELRSESRDGLLWLMEEGKIAQDAGYFSESARVLTDASTLADRFDHEFDKNSLAEEAASIAVNSRMRVFRGSYADRIEIENLRVIASLLAGDSFGAVVAAKRAVERQKDAEVDEAARIKKVNEDIAKRGGSTTVREILAKEGVELNQGAASYLNPLASWLSGMLQLSTGDGNDRQRGETDLRRALAMVPAQQVLAAQVAQSPFDLARAGQPQVVVYFENGVAPQLEQVIIPLVTPWLGLSTIPLPRMTNVARPADAVDVAGGGAIVRTEQLVDLDVIWRQEFDQRLPEIILRTAVMVAAKEGATYAATIPFQKGNPYWGNGNHSNNSWSTSSQIGYALVLAAASIYKGATNQADLRTWRSIPSEVAIAQMPRPLDGLVRVSLVRGGVAMGGVDVQLPDAPVTLVWCRCVVPSRLIVRAVPFVGSYRVPSGTPPAELPSMQPVPESSSATHSN